MQLSMFSSEEPHANHLAWQDFAKGLLTLEANSHSHLLTSLDAIAPSGWSGRTSLASCLTTADEHLQRFWDCSPGSASSRLKTAGEAPASPPEATTATVSRGVCWTLNMSEHPAFPEQSPSGGAVSALSDILETGDVPQRYFLSAKACQGILRRAEKRGKLLPKALQTTLRSVAFAPEPEGQ